MANGRKHVGPMVFRTQSEFKFSGSRPRPIRVFDDSDLLEIDGPPQPSPKVEKPRKDEAALVPRSVPSHLLMISILEQLCVAYAKDEVKGRELFKMISEHLIKMNVVSPMTVLDEMGSIRTQYRYFMQNVLKAGMLKLTSQRTFRALPSAGRLSENVVRLETEHYSLLSSEELTQMQTSRYRSEFSENTRIGKGGFGTVYKATHKLDGNAYAIKKIRFKHSKPEIWLKVVREVKALAALRHSNIVGYNGAWLEHQTRGYDGYSSVKEPVGSYEESGANDGSESEGGIMFMSHSKKSFVPSGRVKIGSPGKITELSDSYYTDDSSSDESCQACVRLRENQSGQDKDGCFSLYSLQRQETFAKTAFKHTCKENILQRNKDDIPDSLSFSQRSLAIKSKFSRDLSAMFDKTDTSMVWSRSLMTRRSLSCDPAINGERVYRQSHEESIQYSEDINSKMHVCLFIQMELCSVTLDQWIRRRNNMCSCLKDFRNDYSGLNLKIFKQILKGVDFIHSQGLIHRDLKPKNIFINEPNDHVKIGDFGLAKDDLLSPSADSFLLTPTPDTTGNFTWSDHTSGVGTMTYASPEQLQGNSYTNKCDIYSLGVLLYEICNKFDTDMEKSRHLVTLREGHLDEDFMESCPAEASAVKTMTSTFPHHRPTAKELLQSELFLTKDQVIAQMKKIVDEKDAEIQRLKHLLEQKDRQLSKLQAEADKPLPDLQLPF